MGDVVVGEQLMHYWTNTTNGMWLIWRVPACREGDSPYFKFNMSALSSHLNQMAEKHAAPFYNVQILKYEVRQDLHLLVICMIMTSNPLISLPSGRWV